VRTGTDLADFPAARPTAEHEAAVQRADAQARRIAAIPPYTVAWVAAPGATQYGQADVYPDGRAVVWLRADLPGSVIEATALHELGHLVAGPSEEAAEDFAYRARRAPVVGGMEDSMALGIQTAQANGRCSACGGPIPAGSQYRREAEDADGFATRPVHVACPGPGAARPALSPARNGHARPAGALTVARHLGCGGAFLAFTPSSSRCARCGAVLLGLS
jgi:hypothetical protein